MGRDPVSPRPGSPGTDRSTDAAGPDELECQPLALFTSQQWELMAMLDTSE